MKMQMDKDNAKRKRNVKIAFSEAQQKKNEENTKIILGLAKARKGIQKRMKMFSMGISVYIFFASIGAALLEPENDIRAYLFSSCWAICTMQWFCIIYVIVTVGKMQVYMLGRGGIIFAFKVNRGLGYVASFFLCTMSVACLPLGIHVRPWVMEFFGSGTWIFLSLYLLIFPSTINQLLRTPKRNAEAKKRRKQQGKFLKSASSIGGSDREGDLASSKKLRKEVGVTGSFISSSGPDLSQIQPRESRARRPSSFIQVSSKAPARAGLDFNEDAAKNAAENGGSNAADSAMANTLMLPAFEAQKVRMHVTVVPTSASLKLKLKLLK